MSGAANFPTALDDDVSLIDVTDGVTTVSAAQHNNLKEAIKALQAKLGIRNTSAPTSIDYRLGHPTESHSHDGASGQGRPVNPTTIPAPSGAAGTPSTLHDHLTNANIHGNSADELVVVTMTQDGALAATTNQFNPVAIGRTLRLVSMIAMLNRPPSGATAVIDVNFGPTSLWVATQAGRAMFRPGATYFADATPPLVTLPSGAVITADADAIGSSFAGSDASITFLFRT